MDINQHVLLKITLMLITYHVLGSTRVFLLLLHEYLWNILCIYILCHSAIISVINFPNNTAHLLSFVFIKINWKEICVYMQIQSLNPTTSVVMGHRHRPWTSGTGQSWTCPNIFHVWDLFVHVNAGHKLVSLS